MIEEGDGAGRLRRRLGYLLEYVRSAQETRLVKGCEAIMLLKYGLTPRTTRKYLGWLEKYGQLEFIGAARNRVKAI